MPNGKARSRGDVPYRLTDPPMSWVLPSSSATAPGMPSLTRFPDPTSGSATPAGFEFSVDPTEALLKSLFQNLTNPAGFARAVIDAEAQRQLVAASRRGDIETTLGTLWRSIPGLPLIVSQKTFVNWALNRPDAVSAAKGFASQAPTPTDATTGP